MIPQMANQLHKEGTIWQYCVCQVSIKQGGTQMQIENKNTNTTPASSLQMTMENIWSKTCGSWENCNQSTIQSFLSECDEHNIDPQFCMSWVEQHRDRIPGWQEVSETSLEWVNEHTSTGSPISMRDD
jgi:hypothetical protein